MVTARVRGGAERAVRVRGGARGRPAWESGAISLAAGSGSRKAACPRATAPLRCARGQRLQSVAGPQPGPRAPWRARAGMRTSSGSRGSNASPSCARPRTINHGSGSSSSELAGGLDSAITARVEAAERERNGDHGHLELFGGQQAERQPVRRRVDRVGRPTARLSSVHVGHTLARACGPSAHSDEFLHHSATPFLAVHTRAPTVLVCEGARFMNVHLTCSPTEAGSTMAIESLLG